MRMVGWLICVGWRTVLFSVELQLIMKQLDGKERKTWDSNIVGQYGFKSGLI